MRTGKAHPRRGRTERRARGSRPGASGGSAPEADREGGMRAAWRMAREEVVVTVAMGRVVFG